MATRMALGLRRLTFVGLFGLGFLILGHSRAYAAGPIKISAPLADATVANLVTESVRIKSNVKRVGFMVDGILLASSASTSYAWDSTAVSELMPTISALGYFAYNPSIPIVSTHD